MGAGADAMATKVLGIEIGERLIKVCETNMGPGVRKVSGCAMFQTPAGAVSDGEIRDPESVASALKENLKRVGMKNRKVVFTISSGRIAIREVTIPPVKDGKIKAIVEANAADYFPVDMSKYHITYTLQERKSTGEDAGCRLLVMAAPVAILEGYFSLAVLLGFSVQALDYAGNSQFRLLETLHNEGVTLYVDINGAYSVTTVLRKSKLLMQRTFPSGVDDYVLAYMSGMDKSEGEYLATLKELGSDYYSPELEDTRMSAELGEYLSRLVGNITRIADYFNSSNWETPIEKLVLTGIGASVFGLKEAVAESTGLPVTVMQKLDKVSAPGSMAAVLPQYISCLGCSACPVDFIPERFSKAKKKETKKKKESISMGVTVLVICVIGALGLSASAVLGYMDALSEKQQLEKKVGELSYTEAVYNNYLSYDKYKDDVSTLESAITSPNDSLRQFIDELEKKMPAEVNVLSATCTKEDVSMNITVATKTAAAKTIAQLRTFETIRDISVGQLSEMTDDSGLKTVTFSVRCAYNYDPVVLASPGAGGAGAAASGAGTTAGGAAPSAGVSPLPDGAQPSAAAPAQGQ
jgi:type IV pilus assembly protein PilN